MRIRVREPRAALGLAMLVAGSGCAPLATHQTAETVPKGRWQVDGAVGYAQYVDTAQKVSTPSPSVELGARRGIGDHVDIGARVFLVGLGLGMKWRVLEGGWSVAIAPELAGSRFGDGALVPASVFAWGSLPVLVSHRLGERVGITFGPKALYGFYQPKTGGTAHGLSVGGLVNVDVRLGRGARVLPELVVVQSVGGDVPVRGPSFYLGPGFVVDL